MPVNADTQLSPRSRFGFELIAQTEGGRAGIITTPHGTIETPAFIFCATKAAIKGLDPAAMRALDTQIVLANTYHLMLDPGPELIAAAGGLHKFMGWNGPLLTDSGGFQVFSLGHGSVAEEIKGNRRQAQRSSTSLLRISEEGVLFRSHINGNRELLTPERSIEVQHQLGVDFVVVFDECTPFHVSRTYTERAMYRSHRWEERSYRRFTELNHDGRQALYGIVQGGVYPDLRQVSVEFINNLPVFGQAVGGSLGATKEQMHQIVALTMKTLRKDRPTHLLGIGGIKDIFWGVKQGIDTFDCVHPTRLARHGGALVPYSVAQHLPGGGTGREHINLRNQGFRNFHNPIDPSCDCSTCTNFSGAYINYLLRAKEILALQLLTAHNVYTINRLFKDIRQAIKLGG